MTHSFVIRNLVVLKETGRNFFIRNFYDIVRNVYCDFKRNILIRNTLTTKRHIDEIQKKHFDKKRTKRQNYV